MIGTQDGNCNSVQIVFLQSQVSLDMYSLLHKIYVVLLCYLPYCKVHIGFENSFFNFVVSEKYLKLIAFSNHSKLIFMLIFIANTCCFYRHVSTDNTLDKKVKNFVKNFENNIHTYGISLKILLLKTKRKFLEEKTIETYYKNEEKQMEYYVNLMLGLRLHAKHLP